MRLILDFAPHDADRIVNGTRCHSIRIAPTGPEQPNIGDDLVLIANHGSPETRRIRTERCEYVQDILILPSLGSAHQIILGGALMEVFEAEDLARCEGFASLDAFVGYYREFGLPFRGLILGWAEQPRYLTRH
jgi:hypothetical protein